MRSLNNPIGLKRGTVKIVPYNPEWPEYFEEEKQRLSKVLGNKVHDIEHVGSTSIPGLTAKPIIDILVSVDDLDDYKQLIKPLTNIGYEFMPDRVFEDRVFLAKGPHANRTHHLSISTKNSKNWNNTIRFRDYLRSHPEARDEYAKLKQALAEKYANDRASYTKAKEDFFNQVVAESKPS